MPSQLELKVSLNVPDITAAVADYLIRALQQHRPQAKTAVTISGPVAPDPILNLRPGIGRRIILHRHRVTQNALERLGIRRRELPQQQTRRLQDNLHTLLHSSDRGSSGLSFCNSCHSSRAFKSRASGTTSLTSTISSPRCPSLVAEGTPFSRRRSFCPLCVPGGILSCERPSIVGTSIFAPSAASQASTGTVT